MVNGLGVLGWGVGGIEAEAAMLGQPMSMLIPRVLGFKLHGELPEGATATDLVLTVTEMLRERGVVGMFVEFYGAGLAGLPLADRATIGNMSPEFGWTCAIFPIDAETLRYLEFSGRPPSRSSWSRRTRASRGCGTTSTPSSRRSRTRSSSTWAKSCRASPAPKRPQDRVALSEAPSEAFRRVARPATCPTTTSRDEASAESFPRRSRRRRTLRERCAAGGARRATAARAARARRPGGERAPARTRRAPADGGGADARRRTETRARPRTRRDRRDHELHEHVQPVGDGRRGILARNALARGLRPKPWVKTSLAPGSKVVTEYLDKAGLTEPLEQLGFNLVGYGCTTCIGNSGPLPEEVSQVVGEEDLAVVSVLSGNRNFEGRINPDVKMNYLASPPLCVAYALAGTMDIDIVGEPLGQDEQGQDVYLRDIWPSRARGRRDDRAGDPVGHVPQELRRGVRRRRALELAAGADGRSLRVGAGLDVRAPAAVLRGHARTSPSRSRTSTGARVLAMLGDSVTTDHISPAGSIKRDGPAGRLPAGARGGAARLQLLRLAPRQPRGDDARHVREHPPAQPVGARNRGRRHALPGRPRTAGAGPPRASRCRSTTPRCGTSHEGVPLVVLGGKEYGSGSSRDWAAKGTKLLGVRAVIAESFERIHRSNLIGMGVLPLQFPEGQSAESLGFDGEEVFCDHGFRRGDEMGAQLPEDAVRDAPAREGAGGRVRGDACGSTRPSEAEYFRHGGILQFVLRQLLRGMSPRGLRHDGGRDDALRS